ncbi:MAG: twin-arginine translocase subunit TatC [Bacteroidales bacterium]|nr:twin-arginine translocase subunit TatC [Bacteroidales bacterium]MDD3273299.1 twin-arginine translocase subunit TatC [Bacteroidales bacterium]MDD4057636.1 twin-arginine translocase subunit TatC [Bacteroidales bacterium]
MTFWDHLDELRRVLFRSAIAIFLLAIPIFLAKDFLFSDIIFAPTKPDFILYKLLGSTFSEDFNLDLINIELSAQFFIHISVSLTLSLILAIPYILYQFWLFVKPGLYENEQKATRRAFGFGSFLFITGVIVGYLFVFPLTLRFLGSYQVSEAVPNQISLQSYISMFTRLILIMGIVFEMPALALILSKIGIISKSLLKKYRKHAFTILVITAAIITPSGDAFTLLVVATPLYLLYEFSILICRDSN